jgi:ParB/RepB/Spo0J family partition protein
LTQLESLAYCKADIVEVPLQDLQEPSWVLRPLDEKTVSELARSIENIGLLQPIVVRPYQGGYEVVFGYHRLEAFRRLSKSVVPALVRSFSDEETFLARVSENILRNANVNPVEEAEGYRLLLRRGWTINDIGRRIGKCDSYVCERLAMLERLDRKVLSGIAKGNISPSHAELLSRVRDLGKQRELSELIKRKHVSVRTLEDLVNGVPLPKNIQVVALSGECCVRIPREFAKTMKLVPGEYLRMRMRGERLILERTDRCKRAQRKESCSPSQIT